MGDGFLKEIILKNGEKLILRRPKEDDAEAIINYLNQVGGESDNLLFGKDEFHYNVEQEKEFIRKLNNDPNTLMIVGIIDDNIVSFAQIGAHQRKRTAHNSDLAISVKKQYWNKGIGSAAMQELINFAKNNSIIKNINLGVKASNDTAIRLYKKFGFSEVGVHKDYFNINGVYDDLILMDLYLQK